MHHELTNHDKFLPDNGFGYAGANGFKTGYTEIADHTLVATAKRNGRQCIAVILGSVDSGYTWAASLLDQCWQQARGATTGIVPAAGRGLAVRDAEPRSTRRLHEDRGRQDAARRSASRTEECRDPRLPAGTRRRRPPRAQLAPPHHTAVGDVYREARNTRRRRC